MSISKAQKPSFVFFYDNLGIACGSLSYYALDKRWSIAHMTNEAVRIGRLRGYTGASLTHSFYDIPDQPKITF